MESPPGQQKKTTASDSEEKVVAALEPETTASCPEEMTVGHELQKKPAPDSKKESTANPPVAPSSSPSPTSRTSVPFNEEEKTLSEKQLDYAWKWFEYHADQRVSMFNYFLVGIGIVITALATLLAGYRYVEAMVLSGAGVMVCVIFHYIDVRNRDLIHMGEKVMVYIERRWLFPNSLISDSKNPYGPLSWDRHHTDRDKENLHPRSGLMRRIVTHGFLIGAFHGLVGFVFFGAFLFSFLVGHQCNNQTMDAVEHSNFRIDKDEIHARMGHCIAGRMDNFLPSYKNGISPPTHTKPNTPPPVEQSNQQTESPSDPLRKDIPRQVTTEGQEQRELLDKSNKDR